MPNTPLFSKQMSIVIDGSTLLCGTDFSLSITRDLINVQCLNSTAYNNFPDIYSWSLSFSAVRLTTESLSGGINYDELANNMITSDASVGVYILPDVSSNNYLSGQGFLASLSMDGAVGAQVTFSGEITGNGPLTQNTVT